MIYCLNLILLFLPLVADASNTVFSAAANQVAFGKFCINVGATDLNKMSGSCSASNPKPLLLQSNAYRILDKLVFADAAEHQAKDDKCVAEALQTIKGNSQKKAVWEGAVISSWLKRKKAQLMRANCKFLFWNSINLAEEKRYGLAKAYELHPHNNPGMYPEAALSAWKEKCLDEDTRAALMNTERLFDYSLPVVSSADAFNIVERQRNAIVSKATGKPITDAELLNMDMHDLGQIEVRMNPNFEKSVDEYLSDHADQRKKWAAKIDSIKRERGNLQSLDSETRDYVYQVGAVTQTLVDKGLMKMNLFGQPSDVSAGAACIMAWNEPSLSGEFLDLAATSFIPAAGIFKALGMTKYAKVSKLSRLKTSALLGAAGVTGAKTISGCVSGQRPTTMVDMKRSDLLASREGSKLPNEVNFQRWNFDFDAKEIPDCVSNTSPNLMALRAKQASCVEDLLFLALPLHLGLPLIVLDSASN